MSIPKLSTLLCALAAITSAAFAGSLDDGNAAYKSRDYNAAVTAYTQAVAENTGDEQAKAYYKLGLSYEKLGNYPKAVSSFQSAQRIDDTLSFAKNKAGFRRKLERDERYATGAASPLTPVGGQGDPAANALTTGSVYVDPTLTVTVDQAALQEVAAENARTTVKIALLSHLPAWYQKLARSKGYDDGGAVAHYSEGLHNHLNMGRNGMIVISMSGYGSGIGLDSGDLTSVAENAIAQKYAGAIQAGDLSQVPALSLDFVKTINDVSQRQQNMVSLVVLIIILVLVAVLVSRNQRKKAEMANLRAPLQSLRNDVEASIEYIDGYLPALAKNNADTDQVKAYRQAAAARFEQATKIIDRATETGDLVRAQRLLEKAKDDSINAKRYLDRATGGTANIPGDSAVAASSLPADIDDLADIPEKQRGVSFFSSRPAPIDKLVPVTINVSGVDRQVLATPTEAAEIRRGQMPPVRAFNVGGRQVPWYMYDSYDPYRDYYANQQNGWSSGIGGVVAGFIGAEMLDSLFSRPAYGGSWMSPYGYAPGWDNWGYWNNYDQGFFDGERVQAHDYAFNDTYSQPPTDSSNAGGAGFFGSGYDQSDYGSSDNAGGAGFFGGGDAS